MGNLFFVTAQMQGNKITPASNMITEDYLKKTLAKSQGGRPFNCNDNRLQPQNMDSAFGNFPKDSRVKKPIKVSPSSPFSAMSSLSPTVEPPPSRRETAVEVSPPVSPRPKLPPAFPPPKPELLSPDPSPAVSSDASTTEEISPSPSTTDLRTRSTGKWMSPSWTTIITSPSSSKVSVRRSTPTGSSPSRECSICSRRVVPRSSPLFPS